MGNSLWNVLRRIGIALLLVSGWVGVVFLAQDTPEIPGAIRKWQLLVPISQTTALIWLSGVLALWVIWTDLRPLILPLVRKYLARRWLRLYTIEWVQPQEAERSQPGRLWEFRCKVRFVRDHSGPRLTIRVRSCIGTNGERTILASSRQLPSVQKNETLVVRFGSLWTGEPGWVPHQSIWGEDLISGDPQGKSIVMGCRNVIEIALGRQRYRIFAMIPTDINQPWNRIMLAISQDEAPALLSLLNTELGKPL